MIIPSHVNNYSVWKDGVRFIGMADITLPNLTNLTDTLKGAGMAGSVEMPVMAHYDDWVATFNFHTITKEGVNLMAQDGMLLEARAGMQQLDPGTHKISIGAWRFIMSCIPKGFDLGKLEIGTKETNAVEVCVIYIKATCDGSEVFEKDKFNMIDRVNGVDHSLPIRQAIGIV